MIRDMDRNELLRKARKWLVKEELEEENEISFPRLMIYHRRKLVKPMRELFNNEIKELVNMIDM